MTTDSDKCSFSSLLPMSCRERAEAFARRLNSRLRSLSTQDGCVADETSWLAANDNSVAVSQPRHSDSDLYFDFALLDSPGSPDEEIPESDLLTLITNHKDALKVKPGASDRHLKQAGTSLSLKSNGLSISSDSDSSDGQYFDPDTDEDSKMIPNHVNGVLEECVEENAYDFDNSRIVCKNLSTELEESPTTSSLTHSEEESTLSIQDYPSLEFISCSLETPVLENNNRKGFDVVDCCKEVLLNSDSNLSDISKDYESLEETEPKSAIPEDKDENKCDRVNGLIDNQCNGEIYTCDDYQSNNEETVKPTETLNPNESYCSTIRIENNFTVDFGATDPREELPNQVIVKVEPADDIEDGVIPRVRRCSSLKTGKTPPGTPGRKKIVRFADVLGLDLADVRTYLDEIPKVPNSAYSDLADADINSSLSDSWLNTISTNYKNVCSKVDRVLVPLFQQPGGQIDFIDRVREFRVCLENALVDDPISLSIKGTVRVRNLDFNKSVHIRYSLDSWKSYADLQGAYVENSCDGFSDKFTFLLYANTIGVGQRLEMAVRFQCRGCQYWDNNRGANYCFQCLPVTNQLPYTPITGADDNWGAAFYYQEDATTDAQPDYKSTAVEDYLFESLEKHKKRQFAQKNPDMITVIIILIFSVLFLYVQRAIYFA